MAKGASDTTEIPADWPRFESDRMLMTVGAYRPLDDALRIAVSELVAWLHADRATIVLSFFLHAKILV